MRQKLKQFIGFGLVGGVNTILTYLIYLTLYQLINPTAAMGVGYGLTSIFGLFLNDMGVQGKGSTPTQNGGTALLSLLWPDLHSKFSFDKFLE